MTRLRVAVLMGGSSAERSVSLSTGRQILAALNPERYDIVAVDTGAIGGRAVHPPTDVPVVSLDLPTLLGSDRSLRPDVAFIALHGRGGEDGCIQGLLELAAIPYTGSGVLASALAMDKAMTKRLLLAEGIPTPASRTLHGARELTHGDAAAISSELGSLIVVKPNTEGSTIGCSIVRDASDLPEAVAEAFRHDRTIILEQFVAGVEITVGLLGNQDPVPLPIIEIVPEGGFYDYAAKYSPGGSRHMIPGRISEKAADLARDYATRTHISVGCRGMSRVDLIVDRDDQPWVLEVNTIPGMTPTSLLPEAARAAGIGFSELLDRLIGSALG